MGYAFRIGASGLSAYEKKLDVAANNIANVDTSAYKPQETSFSNLIYTQMNDTGASPILNGNGVMTSVIGIDTKDSGNEKSDGKYDLAIKGDGFFAVSSPSGTLYTRDGSFTVSVSGDTAYLVNSDGNYVLDAKGEKISTPTGADAEEDLTSLTDKVGVYSFSNPEALTPVSKNCFEANSLTGAATAYDDSSTRLVSGYLELSGVSLSSEMANLITAQRAYQLSARVVQSADEIAQTVNGLRA